MSQIREQADNHKTGDLIPSNQWGSDVSVKTEVVRERLLEIKDEIAPCNSKIVAVTKYYGLNAIIEGYKAGLRDFGESRAKESIEKINSLPKEIIQDSTFHFIGHLQSNKAEKVVEYFDYIHSVDSIKLAKVISESACRLNKREKILLQVNNANEEQKFGYTQEQLREDLPEILKLENIEVVGLMNMAPFGASEQELRNIFKELRLLKESLECEFKIKLPELSMGMSNDYKIAAQEGATIIRIGRKLFN